MTSSPSSSPVDYHVEKRVYLEEPSTMDEEQPPRREGERSFRLALGCFGVCKEIFSAKKNCMLAFALVLLITLKIFTMLHANEQYRLALEKFLNRTMSH